MNLKQIMKRLGTFFDEPKNQIEINNQTCSQAENKAENLVKYEIRRQEIAESSEQINGIFYILDGNIIPDYFSECLVSDTNSPNRKFMYHFYFCENYIIYKYPGINFNAMCLPYGQVIRIPGRTNIYIDKCYYRDEKIMNQLRGLYRIATGTIFVASNLRCSDCKNADDGETPFPCYFIRE